MAEENKQSNNKEAKEGQGKKEMNKKPKTDRKETVGNKRNGGKPSRFRKDRRGADKKDDFDQRILDIARVTRVMAGGKRMRFRACVAVGDKKGKIGVGVAKGADVTIAVNKAVNKAKRTMIDVPMVNDTIPHEIYNKFGAAKLIFKPTKTGRGVIAGGVVRVVLELAGIKNITSKILGTNNKLNNAKCTVEALSRLKKVDNGKKKIEKKEEAGNKGKDKKDNNKENAGNTKDEKNKK